MSQMLNATKNFHYLPSALLLVLSVVLASSAFGDTLPLDHKNLELHVLSMGYADATLLEFPGNIACLIDTGSKETAEKLLDFLKGQDVKSLELVVITHPHDNHYGGLESVANSFAINKVITSVIDNIPDELRTVYNRLKQSNVPILEVRRHDSIELDSETKFEILHPDSITQEPNTDSLVLRILFRNQALLFSADIPPLIQDELINEGVLKQIPNWVMLPHHGGEVSDAFADFVEGAIKVISTGPHDRWRAPDPKTIARFKGGILRTDLDGNLHFKLEGQTIYFLNDHEKL